MKKIFILLSIFLAFSCEKEALITKDDFEVQATKFEADDAVLLISKDYLFHFIINDEQFTQGSNYKIKYSSDKTGVLKLNDADNSQTLNVDVLTDVKSREFDLIYTSNTVGNHSIKVILINSLGVEKEVILNCEFTLPPLDVFAVEREFTLKESTNANFQFKINNYNPLINYQIKVASVGSSGSTNVSSIVTLSNNIQVPTDSFITPIIDNDGYVKLLYKNTSVEAFTNHKNDWQVFSNWKVIVKDEVNKEQSIDFEFNIRPLPRVFSGSVNQGAYIGSGNPQPYISYFFTESSAFGSGVSIVAFELKWFNTITNTDVLIPTNKTSGSFWDLPNTTGFHNPNCYMRVKDSEGYWGPYFQPIFTP